MMVSKSNFLPFVVLLLGSLLPIEAIADAPNILLIVTDEHNFRTLGCYREQMTREQGEMWGPGSVVETPNIDRLAREGLICTKAYATSPVCSPCRAAMITGMYPQNTGVPANDQELLAEVPTLARIANANGYRTGFVGKWHLGGKGKPEWAPKIDGGFKSKKYMFNWGHWKKFRLTDTGAEVGSKDKKEKPSYGLDSADAKSFSTDFLTDRTIEFVSEDSSQPFLAVLSYPDPHGPNTVRAPYNHMYDHMRFLKPRTYGRDDMPVPRWLGSEKKHAKFRGELLSQYFGMLKCIDDNIGRLLSTLETAGKLNSTIVMLTADHGDLCFEHDRLNKGNPYEGSARVPMLVRFPGGETGSGLKPGTVYKQPVGTVDITPTLLSLAGATTDSAFEGRDLSGDWKGAGQGSRTSKMVFLRNAGKFAQWLTVIDECYKLVLSVNDRPWLFDLEEDPDELLNFFGRPGTQEVTKRLATALAQYAKKCDDTHADSPKIAESLRICLPE